MNKIKRHLFFLLALNIQFALFALWSFDANPIAQSKWYVVWSPTLTYLALVIFAYILIAIDQRRYKQYLKDINKHKDDDDYFT